MIASAASLCLRLGNGSYLHCTFEVVPQRQIAVKLHRVFSFK